MKKLIALLLVLVMSLSLFAGCGTEKPADTTAAPVADDTTAANDTTVAASKDPVTITYWYSNGVGEQEYTDEVEAELNKILSETEGYEHITIDLMPCKDYSTDLTLALSSNAQVDLISTPSYGTTDKIKLGEYMPLDDLIAANPEITADLPEWFMEYGKVNGVTYFVPNYQQMGNGMFWYTRADYAEKAGYTAEQISEIILGQDVEERKAMCEALLLAAREIHGGDDKAYLTAHNFAQARAWYSAANNLVDMSWYTFLFYNTETNKVEWLDDQELLQQAQKVQKEWTDKGYSYEYQQTTEGFFDSADNGLWTGEVSGVMQMQESYGTNEMVSKSLSEKFGTEVIAVNMIPQLILGPSNAAGGVAISATSKHAEDAAKVLALLFNGKYENFLNTLAYGIEGVHYNKLTDTTVETLEFAGSQGGADTTYCYHKWRGGNTFNVWNNQSLSEEQEEYIIKEINENPNTLSPLAGFVFDNTNVQTQIEQCKAVVTEYYEAINFGTMDDYDAYHAEYVSKMEAAGIREIIDEYNAQIEAWKAG